MIKLQIDNKDYQLVSSWTEMTKTQFERTCFIRGKHLSEQHQEELNASRIILFTILSNVPQIIIDTVVAEQWVDILPYLNFVFDTPNLNDNPLKKIRIGVKTLYGPIGMLDHSTFKEMITADTYFIRATKDDNPVDNIYKLFATLWRSRSFGPDHPIDKRGKLNDSLINIRAEKYKSTIPFHYAVSSFIYYWSFREKMLVQQFENIFSVGSKTDSKRQGNDYGWAGTHLEISGDKFGDYENTGEQHWSVIMVELSRQIDKAKFNT